MSAPEAPAASAYERLQIAVMPALLRACRRLPPRLGVGLMIAAGIGQALFDPKRLKRAFAWAAAHRQGVRARGATAIALLANRGRFLAWAMGIGNNDPDVLRRSIAIEGRAHLDRALATGGTLLVIFHLGPSPISQCLSLLGYSVVAGGAGSRFPLPDLPSGWKDLPQPARIRWRDPASRATGLYHLTRSLRGGSLVLLAADAPDGGRVEFRVALPGRTLSIRSGWFTLRRLTGAPTLLVLQHWDGHQRVIRVHPALPAPVEDLDRDRAACQAYLSDALQQYVADYPEQCVSLAMWRERPEEPV